MASESSSLRGPGRRRLLWGFVATTIAVTGGGVAGALAFLRSGAGPSESPNRLLVPVADLPAPGDAPKRIADTRVVVVRLEPGEGPYRGRGDASPGGGYLALVPKCTHLGCTVPWMPTYEFRDEKGWFRCPCHNQVFTRSGLNVFGPATRPLDRYACEAAPEGLVVQRDHVQLGTDDNALHAVTL